MSAQELPPNNFNEQQLRMLRLLQKPMPNEDFLQIRRLIVKLLAKQIDQKIADWEVENSITAETYEELAKLHFRSKSNS